MLIERNVRWLEEPRSKEGSKGGVDLSRHWYRRQRGRLQFPVRPAGPPRGRARRRCGQRPHLAIRQEVLGNNSERQRLLGLQDQGIARHRQHDLRGHHFDGDLVGQGKDGRRASRGRSDRVLRARWPKPTPTLGASSKASSGWEELLCEPQSGHARRLVALLPLRPGARRPADRPAVHPPVFPARPSQSGRLVSRRGRPAGPQTRYVCRVFGWGPDRARASP